MRLINAQTREMKDFIEGQIPSYAILSHTWGPEEVTYAEFQNVASREALLGYEKIEYACQQALKDKLQYVWIDTCSIDKSSSAELSEAINSMYRWYKEASICYAFLQDLDVEKSLNEKSAKLALDVCRWFTRGWTLQELIAPDDLIIYGKDWTRFGTKNEWKHVLSTVTGIDEEILDGSSTCNDASVARRMSWAARRETTRTEDAAYCLLGIFNVNMPLLYGEGKRAFVRLQEEILKDSDDMSILAWGTDLGEPSDSVSPGDGDPFPIGVLAMEPRYFKSSAHYVPLRRLLRPVSINARGLSVSLASARSYLEKASSRSHIVLGLGCRHQARAGTQLGVVFKRLSKDQYVRCSSSFGEFSEKYFKRQEKLVHLIKTDEEAGTKNHISYSPWHYLGLQDGQQSLTLTIKDAPGDSRVILAEALSITQTWEPPKYTFSLPTLWGMGLAVLLFQLPQSGRSFAVFFGRLGFSFADVLMVVDKYPLHPKYTLVDVPDVESFKSTNKVEEAWQHGKRIRHKIAIHGAEVDGELVDYKVCSSLQKDKAMGRGAFYLEIKAFKLAEESKRKHWWRGDIRTNNKPSDPIQDEY